ncbi:MAG: helix-turn-helix domain-containing protein [Microbacterium sp.]
MTHTARLRTPGDIGVALQQARIARGLSQVELATEADLPQSTISAIENGMSTIHLRRLLNLARTTGIVITASWEDDGETRS